MARLLSFLFVLVGQTLLAQSPYTNDFPIRNGNFLQGFTENLEGDSLDFLAGLGKGNVALLTRADDGKKPMAFTTAPIPKSEAPFHSFVLGWSMSKATGEKAGQFQLLVNGKRKFTIDSYRDGANPNFSLTNESGDELAFRTYNHNAEKAEASGYLILNLKNANYPSGIPLEIRLNGAANGVQDWLMAFQTPVKEKLEILPEQVLYTENGQQYQRFKISSTYLGSPIKGRIKMEGKVVVDTMLSLGPQQFNIPFPAVEKETKVQFEFEVDGRKTIARKVLVKPVRHFEVYFLPHSHVDIGFTHLQQEVAELQWKNLEQAIALGEKTKDYPEGSKYRWNTEGLWATHGYLDQATPKKRAKMIDAIKKGYIGLDALYANELTGLMRGEELYRAVGYAKQLEKETGIPIDAAMISDVPGYSWGLVPALAQQGVRYFSSGPNHMPHLPNGGYQVGNTFKAWGDAPFYWLSPSGNDTLLFWMTDHGYSWFHSWSVGNISWGKGAQVLEHLGELDNGDYPYDMVQLRYNIGNDNGPPDEEMPNFFKAWNEKYDWPKFIISSTSEMFHAFEDKYKKEIPIARGDFTPYWEDGAASSAEETAINRNAADRLVQAEALWAMQNPGNFPNAQIDQAWRNVVLFSEHTWGANVSKSKPDSEFTKSQWAVKQAFALDAASQAEMLLQAASGRKVPESRIHAVEVFNTNSWPRNDVVTIPASWELVGDHVTSGKKGYKTQRNLNKELLFFSGKIPPFSSKVFRFNEKQRKKKEPSAGGAVIIYDTKNNESEIQNHRNTLSFILDSISGNLLSLRSLLGDTTEFINRKDPFGFNAYWYSELKAENQQTSGPIRFEKAEESLHNLKLHELGSVLVSFLLESDAPGTKGLTREIRMYNGSDKIEIINTIDKLRVDADENVRFSFPFALEGGEWRLDIPWTVMRPGTDQLAGANHNFYYMQRFADYSNDKVGITLLSPDVPMLEIGTMSGQDWMKDIANRPWMDEYKPSGTLFSWVMNNAWFVNYKAYQEGKIKVRYILRTHKEFDPAQSKRWGIESTSPLIPIPSAMEQEAREPMMLIKGTEKVIVTSLKPCRDGKGKMIRLLNASDQAQEFELAFANKEAQVFQSSPLEVKGRPMESTIRLSAWEILTVRVE